ncbi:MAG: hypothetical protein AABZ54_06240 [Bacteroidota bacterium]
MYNNIGYLPKNFLSSPGSLVDSIISPHFSKGILQIVQNKETIWAEVPCFSILIFSRLKKSGL